MHAYRYFTAPINESAHAFCIRCTSSYGCVCDLLIEHGHCTMCMSAPDKCLCKELMASQGIQPHSTSSHVDPVIDQIKQLISDPTFNTPNITAIDKQQMQYFWKEACKKEGVPFTRKEHVAYPRVLATYKQLRREYREQDNIPM